jgi:D-3-phosphoglycerate dehydrogenase
MAGKVVLVEVPAITDMCDIAEAELPKRGHAVVRHASPAAFKAAKDALGEGDVLFALGMPVNRELLSSARLKAVVSPFTGTEFIDVAAATELGIVVGHGQVPGNSIGMAESSIMLMLALLYDLRRSEKQLRENLPRPPRFAHLARGKTVGLVGLGAISREVARRLSGWDMKILAYTPRPRNVPANVQVVGLDELLAQSDVVMVHASMNAETRNLLDARRLAQMKKGAILINTSRGGIVDEKALAAAMHEGRIAGAALDVYETEPLPADSALRDMPNSILTPHMVGQTIESLEELRKAAVENLVRAMEGRAPLYVRNPEVLPDWQRRWANG